MTTSDSWNIRYFLDYWLLIFNDIKIYLYIVLFPLILGRFIFAIELMNPWVGMEWNENEFLK